MLSKPIVSDPIGTSNIASLLSLFVPVVQTLKESRTRDPVEGLPSEGGRFLSRQ